jgi:hypothetical protein
VATTLLFPRIVGVNAGAGKAFGGYRRGHPVANMTHPGRSDAIVHTQHCCGSVRYQNAVDTLLL